MSEQLCGIIVPRQGELPGVEDRDLSNADASYLAECICPDGHDGPHVIRTSEGIYFAWEDDMDCDCCEAGDPDCCYVYWEITQEQFETGNFENA